MWKFQDIPVSRGKENSKDHFGSWRIIISIFPGSKPNIGTLHYSHSLYLSESGPFLAITSFSLEKPPTGILSLPVVNISSCFFCSRVNSCTTCQNHLRSDHTSITQGPPPLSKPSTALFMQLSFPRDSCMKGTNEGLGGGCKFYEENYKMFMNLSPSSRDRVMIVCAVKKLPCSSRL